MTTGYITVTDVRDLTNVQTTEFSDSAVTKMINKATELIDLRTGRTWQEVKTATDEYYDGDDTDLLWLKQVDIQSITSLGIDQAGDNATYTTVTTSYVNYYPEGYIILQRSNAEVNLFKAGTETVKISYTYGNSTPTEAVKELCLLMVRNFMHSDPTRAEEIERLIMVLKRKVSSLS